MSSSCFLISRKFEKSLLADRTGTTGAATATTEGLAAIFLSRYSSQSPAIILAVRPHQKSLSVIGGLSLHKTQSEVLLLLTSPRGREITGNLIPNWSGATGAGKLELEGLEGGGKKKKEAGQSGASERNRCIEKSGLGVGQEKVQKGECPAPEA